MAAREKMVMTKRLLMLTVLAVVLVGGGLFYYRLHNAKKPVTPVTAAVTRGDVVAKVDATGTLAPVTTVQVGSQVSGTIKALHADYNSEVKKGQVVAELDPSLFQTQVEQARATLIKAESDVDRAKVDVDDSAAKARRAQELFDQKLISRNDLETAQATAMQAEASYKSAQAQATQSRAMLNQNQVNLGHTIITAPIDGIVISRSVDVGQTVAASMSAPTLFVIAQDLAHMQVSASIDEADIGRIAQAQPVTFRVDAYPTQTFRGTVSQVRLEPKTDQNVVSYTTMIDVPNEDLKLKPGMTANVTVQIASSQDVLRVPNGSLRFSPAPELFAALGQEVPAAVATASAPRTTPGATGTAGGAANARFTQMTPEQRAQFRAQREAQGGGTAGGRAAGGFGRVWVIRDGKLQPLRVRTGVTDGAMTAIVDGDLKEGDQVVTGMSEPGAAPTQTNTSPLIPFGRRGGGAGGAGGGGARGGAGR
jgi:HlyD family secretion protein